MQTEEAKRKLYNVPEKGGSICLRALNAFLEAAEPREYICTRSYCGCRKNSRNKADVAFNQFFAYTYLRPFSEVKLLVVPRPPHPLARPRLK